MYEIRVNAPTKVNSTLRAGPPNPDAYHPLVTVLEALGLREYLTVRTVRTSGIHIAADAYLPNGSYDRATIARMHELPVDFHSTHRTAKRLQRLTISEPWGQDAAGIDIHVDKHIPMAGGTAGDSVGATTTLVACNGLRELNLSGQ